MKLVLSAMLITVAILSFIFYGFQKLWDAFIKAETRKWDRDV